MDLHSTFPAYIQKENLFHPKDHLFIAVSGGLDSTVLIHLMATSHAKNFTLVHCNFNLRGEESERDQNFVSQLAKKYNAPLLIKSFDTKLYATENKLSIQVAARELRYNWFRELLAEVASIYPGVKSWLLTAHHADDNIETLLMNFFKGTGINGLKAMSAKNGQIVRPLLFAHREELAEYASENKLAYVEDSSNAEDKYTRNYFRHQLLPAVAKVFPQVEQNLSNNIRRFADVELLYRQAVDAQLKKLLEFKGHEVHIPVLKLKKSEPLATIVYEAFKDYGFGVAQGPEIIRLLDSESGKYVNSSTHRVLLNRNWLIISPQDNARAANIVIEERTREVIIPQGQVNLHIKAKPGNYSPPDDSRLACLDADKIKYPLLLRRWKQGDYFYPLGMQKKKKLSRFFIDQKVSLAEKEKTLVLEMDRKIVWVVGRRIDDRFKILPTTKNILEIKWRSD